MITALFDDQNQECVKRREDNAVTNATVSGVSYRCFHAVVGMG